MRTKRAGADAEIKQMIARNGQTNAFRVTQDEKLLAESVAETDGEVFIPFGGKFLKAGSEFNFQRIT